MYPIILKSRRGILKHINSLDNSLKEREKSTKQLDVTGYEMLMGTLLDCCKVNLFFFKNVCVKTVGKC